MSRGITVIGAGSWGTSLALHLGRAGKKVKLWCFDKESLSSICEKRENIPFLPGYSLPDNITATDDFVSVIADNELILWVVPTQFSRKVLEQYKSNIPLNAILISASKGIENGTLLTPTAIFKSVLGENITAGAITGPSFAKEVACGFPTAVVTAFDDINIASKVQDYFSSSSFRVYASTDVVGAELGGALKNVIAIASGMVRGLGFGYNTVSALITRGLTEISRLAVSMGAKSETLSGLAGMGDLVLTCTGGLSRNLQVGERLGKGEKLDEIIKSMNMVAEGVKTTKSAFELARRQNVDMPIVSEVFSILYEGKEPSSAIDTLMSREPKKDGIASKTLEK